MCVFCSWHYILLFGLFRKLLITPTVIVILCSISSKACSSFPFVSNEKRRFKELKKKDEEWKYKKIKARFICTLTIYWPDNKNYIRTGKIEGFISPKKKGKKGFGYDPIFIPNGKKITFAQMSSKMKLNIDHRAIAFKKIKKFF